MNKVEYLVEWKCENCKENQASSFDISPEEIQHTKFYVNCSDCNHEHTHKGGY